MTAYCATCHQEMPYIHLYDYTDAAWRRWELYECVSCGDRRQYAVT